MYYNSNKNNHDYYNSYKEELAELEAYNKQTNIQRIIKVIFFMLMLGLFALGSMYLYKYFYPSVLTNTSIKVAHKIKLESKKPLTPIVMTENELPKSLQLRESKMQSIESIQENATDTYNPIKVVKKSVSPKDIELIVQIIMAQMDEPQEPTLKEQLVAIESKEFDTKDLKESNHYNKIILTENKTRETNGSSEIQNHALVELTQDLNNVLNEPTSQNRSDYSRAISKEVVTRSNEMRIIVVQKGDTLSKIAKKAYGNYDDYPRIFSANPEIIKNPNQIYAGQRLRVPA